MSRASKITFGLSCLLTGCTVVGVHIVQNMERDTLHQGPIKDAKRVAEKRQKKLDQERLISSSDPTKERQKLLNKSEHQLQQELRKKYETMQPLSGQVVTEGGDPIEQSKKNSTQ